MTAAIGWARVKPPGAFRLRRGAWYPVIDDPASADVILNIIRRLVPIPRQHVRIRRHRPEHFSVVVRSETDPNPFRGTAADLGTVYAVCPISNSRIRLNGHPEELECPQCGHRFMVAWEDKC